MKGILPVVAFLMISNHCLAQATAFPTPYTGSGVILTQNFDGLPATGSFSLIGKGPFNLSAAPINAGSLTGWQVMMPAGSNSNAAFAVGTGSSTGNGIYSLGSTGSSERALGSLSSSTGIYAMGWILTNQSGGILNSFTLGFTAEQWRKGGSTVKNNWSFHYKTGIITHMDQPALLDEPNLNFGSIITTASASSLNGNLPENRQDISYTITGINWKPGEQLLLRWDDADENGSDDVMALDNLSFSASLVSGLPQITRSAINSVAARSASIQATINENFAGTRVAFEYDSSALFQQNISIHPTPDTLVAGAGNTTVLATINGLLPGKTYYYRFRATNSNGATVANTDHFTTLVDLPSVTTKAATGILTNSAVLGGTISSEGGAPVTERGIAWWTENSSTPNKIPAGSDTGKFEQRITGLSPGTVLFASAYAVNAAGTAFGDTIRFVTQTTVISLSPVSTLRTNAATVNFVLRTAQNISGLSAANFSLTGSGLAAASVTSINSGANVFTITVSTGSGNGSLGLSLENDNGLSVPINNKPFTSANRYQIDKTPPVVSNITIPDKAMKVGDTVIAAIPVQPDADSYKLLSGSIDGFSLTAFTKKNDSLYNASFIVTNGGTDIGAAADIPVSLSLQDSAGNITTIQSLIHQSSDAIDANKPFVVSIQNPPKGLYVSGDTLWFTCKFSEKLTVTSGTPSITLTIGTRTRNATYINGSGADSLLFRYVTGPGDLDMDGIKTSGTITLNNAIIKDAAGNIAVVGFNNTSGTKDVLIDAVVPVITTVTVPVPAVYKTGNLLDFLVGYSRKVFLNAGQNQPYLPIIVGNSTRKAWYVNGSGSNSLLFRYTVLPDDADGDGVQIAANLADSSFSIRDSVGNRAPVLLNSVGTTTAVLVNPPTIAFDGMLLPEGRLYHTGDTLVFGLVYNENVFVTGVPSLKFTVGTISRQANYVQGSGTNGLLFSYTVQNGDEDTDGIKITGSLTTTNATIKDANGNNAPVIVPVANTSEILIDGIAPVITGVQVPANGVYKTGDSLSLILNFSESVFLSIRNDTPFIKSTIGAADRLMKYIRGSGTNNLLFSYLVQPGDLDKNGIGINASLVLNNNLFTDKAGNPANTVFKISGTLSNIKVDAVAPVFSTPGIDTMQVCANGNAVILSNAFAVTDEESGELISWKIKNAGKFGTISTLSYSAGSTGKNIVPSGINYTPSPGKSGIDTIVTEITDGIYTMQKMIILYILPSITNNRITSSQLSCAGQRLMKLSGSVPAGGTGAFGYLWDVSSDSVHFNTAADVNNISEYTPGPQTATTWFRRRIISGACADTSVPVKITIVKNGVWLGRENNSWSNANNWCGNILPVAATDVLIQADTPNQPNITDSARCNYLTLMDGASLTINGVLELNGNFVSTPGTVDAQNATLVVNGSNPQFINGVYLKERTVKNIIINNKTGAVIMNDLWLSGRLILNDGTLQTNDHLFLRQDASIGASAQGTAIAGKVLAEHIIPGGRRVFHFIANPFSNDLTLQVLRDSIDITGDNGAPNGFTSTVTNQPSAFYFDPVYGNDSSGMESGWQPFTNTTGLDNNRWRKNSGIRLLMRGRPGQGLDGTPAGDGRHGTYLPLPVTLGIPGELNTGEQVVTLPSYRRPTYHVVANPYLSTIDLSRVSYGSDISNHYWTWNPLQGLHGGYSAFIFRSRNLLPSFATLIVRSNGNNNNRLIFTEQSKSTSMVSDIVSSVKPDDVFYLELRLMSDSVFWDRILLMQIDSARTGFDTNDAEKFKNDDVNFYSLDKDQKMLSIDARPLHANAVIPLGIQSNQKGAFRIQVTNGYLPTSYGLMLHDIYRNTWTPLEKDSSYAFSISDDTASVGNRRFEIAARKPQQDTLVNKPKLIVKVNPVPAFDRVVVQYHSPEKANTGIRILSLGGKPLKTISLGLQSQGQTVLSISDLLPGIYLLEVRSGDNIHTQKIIKQ